MQVKAAIATELNGPWHTELIEIDEPHAHEVKVKMSSPACVIRTSTLV